MPLYNVHYTGPTDFEVEAESSIEAEIIAQETAATSWYWGATEIEDDDNG